MAVTAIAAEAYTVEISPGSVCLSEKQSNPVVEEYAKLLSPPAEGATVVVGTPVTFSAQSGVGSPMRFMVASTTHILTRHVTAIVNERVGQQQGTP